MIVRPSGNEGILRLTEPMIQFQGLIINDNTDFKGKNRHGRTQLGVKLINHARVVKRVLCQFIVIWTRT